MASTCEQVEQGKTSWPELVGETGECAATIIMKENPLPSLQPRKPPTTPTSLVSLYRQTPMAIGTQWFTHSLSQTTCSATLMAPPCPPMIIPASSSSGKESAATKPPPQPNPNYTAWVSNDVYVRMLITSIISEASFQHVQDLLLVIFGCPLNVPTFLTCHPRNTP
ncbi:hypothetical protein OSB04_011555 [Centaurea solstitialis]|uniref:Uncharacterized protein n=1 Tax=Centaurea solstitialis TaxID=347529 RepID=A0AA38WQ58_9ASTR|nr:hypothetical protein OSB04_011555 [Centaurea solstitialis]